MREYYPIVAILSKEGYIATVPDLPGCSAFGETWHLALVELEHAKAAWIEAAIAAGNPVPKPSAFESSEMRFLQPKPAGGK